MKQKFTWMKPEDIEQRSFEIIEQEMKRRGKDKGWDPLFYPVVKRVIHTTADFSYADTLCCSEGAAEKGMEAIQRGAVIVTDTNMARAGINKKEAEKNGGKILCFMSDQSVEEEAAKRGATRAAVSMERAAGLEGELIFAIGNAPTALIRLCELMQEGAVKPALVIGAPVGFVNVAEAKDLLSVSGAPYIISKGAKGGSNVAAAIVNALLYLRR